MTCQNMILQQLYHAFEVDTVSQWHHTTHKVVVCDTVSQLHRITHKVCCKQTVPHDDITALLQLACFDHQ